MVLDELWSEACAAEPEIQANAACCASAAWNNGSATSSTAPISRTAALLAIRGQDVSTVVRQTGQGVRGHTSRSRRRRDRWPDDDRPTPEFERGARRRGCPASGAQSCEPYSLDGGKASRTNQSADIRLPTARHPAACSSVSSSGGSSLRIVSIPVGPMTASSATPCLPLMPN